jgi:hypothetical protein
MVFRGVAADAWPMCASPSTLSGPERRLSGSSIASSLGRQFRQENDSMMFHALVELRGCMSPRLRTFRAGITAEQAMVIVINLGPSALAGRHCATVFARWVRYAKSNIDLTLV